MTSQSGSEGRPAGGRSRVTWVVTVVVAVLAVVALAVGTRALLRAVGVLEIDAFAEVQGGAGQLGVFSPEGLRTAEGITAAVALGAGLVCLFLAAGMLGLRPWAREGVAGVFGLGGGAFVALSLAGLAQGGPNAALGLAAGVAMVVLALGAWSPACGRDVRGAERRRTRAREAVRPPSRVV